MNVEYLNNGVKAGTLDKELNAIADQIWEVIQGKDPEIVLNGFALVLAQMLVPLPHAEFERILSGVCAVARLNRPCAADADRKR